MTLSIGERYWNELEDFGQPAFGLVRMFWPARERLLSVKAFQNRLLHSAAHVGPDRICAN